MRYLLIAVLALYGCCPHQEIRIVASSERGVTIYDPNNGITYNFYTDSWDAQKRRLK